MVALNFTATAYPPSIQGDILAGALALASRGLPVFPCRADKKPATQRGFYDASTDIARIKAMFSHPGAALIGVPTGEPSGLIAIDVDLHGASDGTAWYNENIDALPPTLTHGTRTGGCHLIFKMPAGVVIKNSPGRVALGIDVRGAGGYIIVPPSPGYSILNDVPPADMPDWLISACLKPETPSATAPPAMHAASDSRADKWALSALDGECGAVMRAPDGTRNARLNVAAVKLGSIVGGGALSRSMVEGELTRAAMAAGLDSAEITATIRSGIEHGLTTPRGVPERETQRGPDTERNAFRPTETQELLDWMCAHSWAALDIPPEPRLLGDLLTSTARVFIVGSTGLGKTQLGHGMAVGIASGAGFLHWKAERAARVLLIDGEMSASLIKDRIGSALQRTSAAVAARNLVIYGLDRSEEFALRFPDVGLFEPLNTVKGQEFILRLIDLAKPDVIIFDNVMSLISGDQKDEMPWSETLPLVGKITAMGIGQVWLDHTGHDRSRQYGSATKAWRFDAVGIMSAVEDAADGVVAFQLSFDSPGKARRRSPENWQDFAPHVITLAGDRWSSQAAGKKVSAGGVKRVKPSHEAWYDALIEALSVSQTPGQATEDEWFAAGVRRSLTEAVEDGDTRSVKETKRSKFRTAKSGLVTAKWVIVNGEIARDLLNGAKPTGFGPVCI